MTKAKSICGILLISFLAVTASATPPIEWSVPAIEKLMSPGLHLQQDVSFVPSKALSSINVLTTPGLQQYVSVSPSSFSSISAGETYRLTIAITIPDHEATPSKIEGTIHLRQGSKTLATPLSVELEINVASAQLPEQNAIVHDSFGSFPVNELIVDLKPGVSPVEAAEIVTQVDGAIIGFVPSTNAYQVKLATATIAELESAANTVQADPRVEEVLKDYVVTFFSAPSDLANLLSCSPDLASAYEQISLQAAWDTVQSVNPALNPAFLGIIDSGTNRNHQEFANVDTGAFSQLSSPNDTSDIGHGTSVAGIVGGNNVPVLPVGTCSPPAAASQMTGIIAGVPGVDYHLRIRGAPIAIIVGFFLFDNFVDTLAAEHVSVINISWGTPLPLRSYFERHMRRHPGILFVMAVPDDAADASSSVPASIKLPNAITVAASDAAARAGFSSFGPVVDIAAPGVAVWAPTFTPDMYARQNGTSFSAPMVTGTAGLLYALGLRSPANVKFFLTASGDPIATDKFIGGRRLNVLCAVQLVSSPSGVMNDDFSGSTRDCSRWFTTVEPPGLSKVVVTNQQLEMTRINPASSSYQGLATRCSLAGDFDVQVDYKLVNWPTANFYTVRLAAQNLPQGNIGLVGVYRNSYADENYQFRNQLGSAGFVHVPTQDTSGTMGLRRVGSTISAYNSHGTIGSAPTTTNPTGFVIDFATPSPTSPLNVGIAFDNFKVNAGTVTCP